MRINIGYVSVLFLLIACGCGDARKDFNETIIGAVDTINKSSEVHEKDGRLDDPKQTVEDTGLVSDLILSRLTREPDDIQDLHHPISDSEVEMQKLRKSYDSMKVKLQENEDLVNELKKELVRTSVMNKRKFEVQHNDSNLARLKAEDLGSQVKSLNAQMNDRMRELETVKAENVRLVSAIAELTKQTQKLTSGKAE